AGSGMIRDFIAGSAGILSHHEQHRHRWSGFVHSLLYSARLSAGGTNRAMMRTLAFVGLILLAGEGAAPGADLAPAQKATICGTRASCRIVAVNDAGKSAGAVNLTVAEARFALADKPESAPDDGCRNDEGDNDGGHEFWLLQGADAPKLLLALCNDGYG